MHDLQLIETNSQNTCGIYGHKKFLLIVYGKIDFTEGSKILLDTDLKIIFLDRQNNFVETLKIISMLQKIWSYSSNWFERSNYFDSSTKVLDLIYIQLKF